MTAVLIRHGQTQGNRQRRYIGRTDQPLSPEGAAQAAALGGDPEVETVYVSPMLRARQTAQILFPRARQIPVEGLREMDFGDFEGKTARELVHDPAYRAWVEGGCASPCPGGEGLEDFSRRACAAFAQILARAEGERVVLVAHGGTIMAVMERFARPERGYFSYHVDNCRGFSCRVTADEQGRPVLTDCLPWGVG